MKSDGVRIFKLSILLVSLLVSGFAHSENNKQAVISNFSEDYNPQVNVSGGVLIGFQLLGSIPAPDLTKLYVARPKDVDKLNLSITSMDGKYKAEMEVQFIDSDSFWTELSIPSSRTAELKGYSVSELVTYAYTEEVDKRSKRKRTFHRIYPTSWGRPQNSERFDGYFYINSGITKPKYILNKEQFECSPTDSVINTAFNKYCVLSNDFGVGDNLIFLKTGVRRKFLVWRPE